MTNRTYLREARELREKAELSIWAALLSSAESALEPGTSVRQREHLSELASFLVQGIVLDQQAMKKLDEQGAAA